MASSYSRAKTIKVVQLLTSHLARFVFPAVQAAKLAQANFDFDMPLTDIEAVDDEEGAVSDTRILGQVRNAMVSIVPYSHFVDMSIEQCGELRLFHLAVDFRPRPNKRNQLLSMPALMMERGRAYSLARQHMRYLLDRDADDLADRFIKQGQGSTGPECEVSLCMTDELAKLQAPMHPDEIEAIIRDWLVEHGMRGHKFTIKRGKPAWTFVFSIPVVTSTYNTRSDDSVFEETKSREPGV